MFSIHGPHCSRSARNASTASTVRSSSRTTRWLPVLVAPSVSAGFRLSPTEPCRSIEIMESIVNLSPTRSVHRSADRSDRRAPVTAASRKARPAATSNAEPAAITARTSSDDSADRGCDLRRPSVARATTLVATHPHRAACDSAARRTRC